MEKGVSSKEEERKKEEGILTVIGNQIARYFFYR